MSAGAAGRGRDTGNSRTDAEQAVLDVLLRRLPGHLPGWRPRPGSPGHALLEVLARYAGLVDNGLARLTDAYLLRFLDTTGTTLLPPAPARVPLVLALADDAPTDVALPAGTEVAAVLPEPLPGATAAPVAPAAPAPVVFATEQATTLVRARLASLHDLDPADDSCAEHATRLGTGFTLFGGPGARQLVPHHLYLGHPSLFDIKGSADISLQVGVARPRAPRTPAAAAPVLRWEYLTAAGWQPFEPVMDQTHGFGNDGEVLLRKIRGAPLVRGRVGGVDSYWLRARTVRPLGAGTLPWLDTLRARVTVNRLSLPLDAAFQDGRLLDTTKDFLPLGAEPVAGSSALFACDDAFRRAGARITLTLTPSAGSTAVRSEDRALVWEYSTGGGGWAPLPLDAAEQLQQGAPRELAFVAPADWQSVPVLNQDHFWLRVHLARGDYGRTELGGDGRLVRPTPPLLARLTVSYGHRTGPREPAHVLTLNRYALDDRTGAARWGREPFQPLRRAKDTTPAVYAGFDAPLPVGLVSLYVHTARAADSADGSGASPFTWEYRSADGWAELSVLDGTEGFRRSGTVRFVAQPDMCAAEGPEPGSPLYWLRARLKTAGPAPGPLPVAGLYLNAVPAAHRTTVRDEAVGRTDGSPSPVFTLRRPPVLEGQWVEVQEWQGESREWQGLFHDVPQDALRTDRGRDGRVTAVRVRWEERPHLHGSGPADRHYTLERHTGLLRFGDGRHGMAPPPGATITATYTTGGGTRGNVPPGTLTQLYSAVPYVDSVTNPVAATGGAEGETTATSATRDDASNGTAAWPWAGGGGAGGGGGVPLGGGGGIAGPGPLPGGVRARGPQRLRHRDRALAASDYVWLAREASPEVALAHCTGATLHPAPAGVPDPGDPTSTASGDPSLTPTTPGRITLTIAPWSTDDRPTPSAELLRRVQLYLARRAPAALAGGIRVIGPHYQRVSVAAEFVTEPERAAEVEQRLRTALDLFLHPLYGGPDGSGWGFGEDVPLSNIALVVESTPGVVYATALHLTTDGGAVHGERAVIRPGRLPAPGRHLLKPRPPADGPRPRTKE